MPDWTKISISNTESPATINIRHRTASKVTPSPYPICKKPEFTISRTIKFAFCSNHTNITHTHPPVSLYKQVHLKVSSCCLWLLAVIFAFALRPFWCNFYIHFSGIPTMYHPSTRHLWSLDSTFLSVICTSHPYNHTESYIPPPINHHPIAITNFFFCFVIHCIVFITTPCLSSYSADSPCVDDDKSYYLTLFV